MTILYTTIDSPLGPLLLTAEDGQLIGVHFPGQKHDKPVRDGWQRDDDDALLTQARQQLSEYFAGERKQFDLPLAPHGTPFQQAVWNALRTIPFGVATTYSDIATRIGKPSAVRAVGAAVGANPIGIVVPCHRVVGADGSLTGYAGGLDRKVRLLELEGTTLALHA